MTQSYKIETKELDAISELVFFAEAHNDDVHEGEEWQEQRESVANAVSVIKTTLGY